MEITIEQNVTNQTIEINQITNEITLDIVNQNVNFEAVIEQLGTQGFSAYEIDVQNGFVGTKEEWSNIYKTIKIFNLPQLP